MELHPVIGERILKNVADYEEIARVVRHHHERVDGHGYPDGLAGDAIPLVSRIIAVADAYDAMTSDRPYRDAMPPQVARLRMAQAVGSQFDTTVVAAFEAILAGAPEEYRLAQRSDFLLEEDALNVLIGKRRHRAELAVGIEAGELGLAREAHGVRLGEQTQRVEIDESMRGKHGQDGLLVSEADDDFRPRAAGHVRERRNFLGRECRRVPEGGERDTRLFEEQIERARPHMTLRADGRRKSD